MPNHGRGNAVAESHISGPILLQSGVGCEGMHEIHPGILGSCRQERAGMAVQGLEPRTLRI